MTEGPYRNATLDTVLALERAPSVLKVSEVLRRAIEPYGFDTFLCAAPPRPDEGPLEPLLLDGWPRGWLERYVGRSYIMRDATVRMMFATQKPFTWDEAVDHIRPEKRDLAIFHEARAWGMCRGFVVPIFGVGGHVHAVSLSGGEDVRLDAEARAQLHLIAMYAYGRAQHLRRRPEPHVHLTARQIEVLHWAAAGKSDWEIGQFLRLSESTVHKHVEGAKRAFGVGTRIQAIVAALRQGSIQI